MEIQLTIEQALGVTQKSYQIQLAQMQLTFLQANYTDFLTGLGVPQGVNAELTGAGVLKFESPEPEVSDA